MPRVEGLPSVLRMLASKEREAVKAGEASVIVGYTQEYAVYVHENLQARHEGHLLASSDPPKLYPGVGRAKFLEEPARTNKDRYAAVVSKARQNGATLIEALYLGGLALQRDSQQLCPVHAGVLRASATTRKEAGE